MFTQSGTLPNEQLTPLLNQAAALIAEERLEAAEALLMRLLMARAGDADALNLLGTIRMVQQRPDEAETLFRRSLARNARQAHVLGNLGQVLRQQGRQEEALNAYREAVRLAPDSAESQFGLATALHEAHALDDAERAYRAALKNEPGHVACKLCLGGLLNDMNRFAEAEALLQEVATETAEPAFLAAINYSLGIARSKQNDNEAALKHFEQSLALSPSHQARHSMGNVLRQMGRDEEAAEALKRAVADNPLNLEAHRDLNQLLYRLRRDGEFLASYDEAAARAPGVAAIPLAKAAFLAKQDKHEEALELFERVRRAEPQHVDALGGAAASHFFLKDYEKAQAFFAAALSLQPENAALSNGLAATFLMLRDPDKALQAASHTLSIAPYDQTALAALGSAWRMQNDGREFALNGYDTLIRVFDLEPPHGYADMDSFNRDLNAYLDRLHPDAREYIDQSLRNGTQTVGDIFGAGHDLVERLRARIAEAVARYIAELPGEARHPLMARRKSTFGFSGSWSSRLTDCGYHTNHLHPNGWISSAYYVALPALAVDAEEQAGWIKFGEASYDLGFAEPVRRAVEPKPGRLVLFPSYMWHGTVPFRSKQSRTTIAFDAVPQ